MLGTVGVKSSPVDGVLAAPTGGVTAELTGGDSIRAKEAVRVEENFQMVRPVAAKMTKATRALCSLLFLEPVLARLSGFNIKSSDQPPTVSSVLVATLTARHELETLLLGTSAI